MNNCNTKHLITRSIQDFNRQCERQSHSRKNHHKRAVQKVIQNYCIDMSDCIGSGTFSRVYKARQIKSDTKVAVKIIQLRKIKELGIQNIFWEQLQIIKRLKHPNVVQCYQYFRTVNNCYTVYQYCQQGDLTKIINKAQFIDKDDLVQINSIIKDVFQGLLYLTNNNIIHRDIKPANVFISKGRAKIGDFGFATYCHTQFKDISIGSPAYMAPQGLLKHIYGLKTDVWSFGILIFEMIHGKTPFCDCQSQEQLRQKIRIPLNWDQFKGFLPSSLKRLMLKCLKVDYEQRQSFQELYKDQYISKLFLQQRKRGKDKFYNSRYTKQTSESEHNNLLTSQRNDQERTSDQVLEDNWSQRLQKRRLNIKEGLSQVQSIKNMKDEIDISCKISILNEQTEVKVESETHIISSQEGLPQGQNYDIPLIQSMKFLKEDEQQNDLQIWLQTLDIFKKIIYMSFQMQNQQLSSRFTCIAYSLALEILQRAQRYQQQQISTRLQKQIISLAQRYNKNEKSSRYYVNDISVINQSLFRQIKNCQHKLDIQDIENYKKRNDYKQLSLYSNLLIIARGILQEVNINHQKQKVWIKNYRSCALQSSEQFYIWLYELELQLLNKQQEQKSKSNQ